MGSLGEFFRYLSDIKEKYITRIFFEAASLSFYTIFSIIPLLLILFSLFTNSPFFEKYFLILENFIYNSLMPGKSSIVAGYLSQFIKNSSKLGILGFGYGLVASILFFINFEYLMNKIFDVDVKRDIWSTFTTFWTLSGFVPIALIFSFYLSIKIKQYVNLTFILPFLIVWFIIFLMYAITPNRKINRKAVGISSLLAAIFWTLMKNFFISYLLSNKIYLTIFGSLSIILFIFIWIYISWIIIISGAYFCAYLDEKFTY